MSEWRKSRARGHGLVWLLCAVGILGSLVVLLPWRDCPCRRPDWDFFAPFETWDVAKLESMKTDCPICRNRHRISPWREWTHRPPSPIAD